MGCCSTGWGGPGVPTLRSRGCAAQKPKPDEVWQKKRNLALARAGGWGADPSVEPVFPSSFALSPWLFLATAWSSAPLGPCYPPWVTVTQGPFQLLLVLRFGWEKSQAKLKLCRALWSPKYLPKVNQQ